MQIDVKSMPELTEWKQEGRTCYYLRHEEIVGWVAPDGAKFHAVVSGARKWLSSERQAKSWVERQVCPCAA